MCTKKREPIWCSIFVWELSCEKSLEIELNLLLAHGAQSTSLETELLLMPIKNLQKRENPYTTILYVLQLVDKMTDVEGTLYNTSNRYEIPCLAFEIKGARLEIQKEDSVIYT